MATEGMRGLIGRKMTKETKFVGESIKISKLSVAQVLEIQESASTSSDTDQGIALLRKVIRMSAEGASDISDEEFAGFPMEELSKLATEIMKFSGISGEAGK